MVAVLMFAIFVQSAAGFAAGMLAVPLLMGMGYALPTAMGSMLVATIPQNVLGVWRLRRTIRFRQVTPMAMIRIAMLPIGVGCLSRLDDADPAVLRCIVGGVVLALTLLIMSNRTPSRRHLHPAWAVSAFAVSGFFQGLVGMGGPVMVLWVQSHRWSTARSRGFLFAMYTISVLPAIGVLYAAFGNLILSGVAVAAVATPVLLLATRWGLAAGDRLGRERLRHVTFALLIVIGVSGLLAPIW